MDTDYHLRREREQNILRRNATGMGIAAIYGNLARLHHDAAEADPAVQAPSLSLPLDATSSNVPRANG